ncbi:MAG: hypothetical protein AAGK67_02165 [Pseudomonadota bacterium]
MRYIYHLGVHTTPTDLIHENLRVNIDALRANSVFYVNEEMPGTLAKIHHLVETNCQSDGEPDRNGLGEINIDIAKTARDNGYETVLFVDENILGPTLADQICLEESIAKFYDDADKRLSLATSSIPLRASTFLIYRKSQEQLLIDLFSKAVAQGQTALTLENFCAAIDLSSVRFDGLAERLQALHSKLRVQMPMDRRIDYGSGAFINEFCGHIGVPTMDLTVTPSPVKYRIDAQQAEALRHVTMGNPSTRPSLIDSLREQILQHKPDLNQPLRLPEWVKAGLRGEDQPLEEAV